MKKTEIPIFSDPEELFKFLKDNKSMLTAEKKYFGKEGEPVSYVCPLYDHKTASFKANIASEDILAKDELQVKLAINTTNLLDSHSDVHLPGLWKKSLKESGKSVLHLQEHKNGFAGIIADGMDGEVKAFTELMTWKDLGFKFEGSTEVLVFESTVKKSRNPYMFEQYAKKYVKNHSVGMQYVKMFLCINSEEKYYREEKDNWDTYYPKVANKDAADERGYFWAVTEAKVIEGSAVPRGSNWATPTIDMKSEPVRHSEENIPVEPAKSTPLNVKEMLNHYKF